MSRSNHARAQHFPPPRPSRRGKYRHNTPNARTRGLFDKIGIIKRSSTMYVYLSHETHEALLARAVELGVFPSGLAAFLVETGIRSDAGQPAELGGT